MARVPPVLVDFDQVADWAITTTPRDTAGTISWIAGDLILAIGGVGDESSGMGVPTATGLTFSQIALTNNPSGNFCDAWMWVAVAAGSGTDNVTFTRSSGASGFGGAALVFRDSEGNGTPVVGTSTTKTLSLTRTLAESAVVQCGFDWSASSATATFTPSGATTIKNAKQGGSYSVHIACWEDEDAAGTASYGVTSISTGSYAKIAVEIFGSDDSVVHGTVTVPAAATAINAQMPAPTVSGVRNATVAAVVMAATAATMVAPTIAIESNVGAAIGVASAQMVAPAVTSTQAPTVVSPVMAATAQAFAPTAGAAGSVNVNVVGTMDATAEAPTPQVLGFRFANVAAVSMDAVAQAVAPSTVIGDQNIIAPPMEAVAQIPSPAPVVSGNAIVIVPMTAHASEFIPPVVSNERIAAIHAPTMDAVTEFETPEVAPFSVFVNAMPMIATAQAHAPFVSGSSFLVTRATVNFADALFLGEDEVDKIMVGEVQVWPSG